MIKQISKSIKLLRLLLLVIGFAAFIFLIFWLSWKYFERQAEADVSSINPTYFPIVAFQTDKSEVIMFSEIEGYKKQFPNVSFLVSQGKEELIKQQLQKNQQERGGKGIPEIRASEISEGKQLIEFEIHGDGFYLSRYEATDKTIKPLMFKLSGPGFVFFPCITTFIVGFLGFIVLRITLWSLKNRQKVL